MMVTFIRCLRHAGTMHFARMMVFSPYNHPRRLAQRGHPAQGGSGRAEEIKGPLLFLSAHS